MADKNLGDILRDPALAELVKNAVDKATSSKVSGVTADSPIPDWKELLPWVARATAFVAGGYFLRVGIDTSAWTGQDWITIVTILGLVVNYGYSLASRFWIKWKSYQASRASAAASAEATARTGQVTAVVVQPSNPSIV